MATKTAYERQHYVKANRAVRDQRLDSLSPLSYAEQIANILRAQIEQSELPARTKLSAHAEARRFGVALRSANYALEMLVTSGHAVAIVGRGTFVKERRGKE